MNLPVMPPLPALFHRCHSETCAIAVAGWCRFLFHTTKLGMSLARAESLAGKPAKPAKPANQG